MAFVMTPTVVEAARGAPAAVALQVTDDDARSGGEPEVEKVEIDAGRFVEMKEARPGTGGWRDHSAT